VTASNVANKKLSDRAVDVVNFIEQTFWLTGGMPTYEVIAEKTGESVKYVESVVEKNPLARKALVVRGVNLEKSEAAARLTSQQLMAANLALNAHDKRTLREKLDLLGISSQQWHAWLRQPGFSTYMSKRAEAAFQGNDHAAYAALAQNIDENDLNAVKFHFEMRGKYKQQLDINFNVQEVVMHIVEIVAKHVKDPDIIIAIAEEISQLEGVDNGSQQSMGPGQTTLPQISLHNLDGAF
jgi:hypothetical protein